MHHNLAEGPFALFLTTRINSATSLHLGKRERTGSIVLCGDELKRFNAIRVPTLPHQEFRSLLQADDGNTCDAHGEYKGTGSIPYVSPPLIVSIRAIFDRGAIFTEIGKEGPGEKACD